MKNRMFERTYIDKFIWILLILITRSIFFSVLSESDILNLPQEDMMVFIWFLSALVAIALYLFLKVTIKVEEQTLQIKTFFGLFNQTFNIDQIQKLELIEKKSFPGIKNWLNMTKVCVWFQKNYLSFNYKSKDVKISIKDNKQLKWVIEQVQKN